MPKNKNAYLGGLKLAGSSASFTVNQGATLHLGNGTDPAMVIIDKPHLSGAQGFVDFGGSEGVFVGVAESTIIQPVLKGTAGITFVSPPALPSATAPDYRTVRVLGNNLHSGGTYVSSVRLVPENAGAFGVGDVHVGGGTEFGGRIYFNTAGLVFTNRFHIAGYGKRDTQTDDGMRGYGALSFAASTEISGDVEVVEQARLCCTNSDDVAKFSGVISGAGLQIYNGVGTIEFTAPNTYTGGTEIVAARLRIRAGGTLGTGGVLLDGGTLVIDKSEAFTLPNRISGKGTVRLEGAGAVTFEGGFDCDSYTGLVSDNFTLALGGRKRYAVSSLDGFSAVTTDSEGTVDLYVADGGSFAGDIAANITIHAGEYVPPGMVLNFR